MEQWEIKYNELKELIPTSSLTEVLQKQREMYDLIPNNILLNDYALRKSIEKRFKDTDEWRIHENKSTRKYIIKVGDISDEQINDWMEKLSKSIKNTL